MRSIFILWISIIQMTVIIESTASPCTESQIPNPEKQTSTIRRGKRDSDIQFPDEPVFVPAPKLQKPKCANGSTFCEEIDNYPTAHVDLVLKTNAHKYEDLFGADILPEVIGNRNNGIDEEESLCKSQERVIHPQAGQTRDNTWMYIVNQQNYTQGVRVEECTHTKECDMTNNFPLGYITKCKQKFIYRQLLAISDNGDTVKELFKLPSCCQCVLTRT